MKTLDACTRKGAAQAAAELFYATWKIVTRTIVRCDLRSVSWVVCADLTGSGKLPEFIVAGGVCDSEPQARAAIRQHYELWTTEGPAAMRVLGRAGW